MSDLLEMIGMFGGARREFQRFTAKLDALEDTRWDDINRSFADKRLRVKRRFDGVRGVFLRRGAEPLNPGDMILVGPIFDQPLRSNVPEDMRAALSKEECSREYARHVCDVAAKLSGDDTNLLMEMLATNDLSIADRNRMDGNIRYFLSREGRTFLSRTKVWKNGKKGIDEKAVFAAVLMQFASLFSVGNTVWGSDISMMNAAADANVMVLVVDNGDKPKALLLVLRPIEDEELCWCYPSMDMFRLPRLPLGKMTMHKNVFEEIHAQVKDDRLDFNDVYNSWFGAIPCRVDQLKKRAADAILRVRACKGKLSPSMYLDPRDVEVFNTTFDSYLFRFIRRRLAEANVQTPEDMKAFKEGAPSCEKRVMELLPTQFDATYKVALGISNFVQVQTALNEADAVIRSRLKSTRDSDEETAKLVEKTIEALMRVLSIASIADRQRIVVKLVYTMILNKAFDSARHICTKIDKANHRKDDDDDEAASGIFGQLQKKTLERIEKLARLARDKIDLLNPTRSRSHFV